MANRVMQQKRLKMARERRAWAKPLQMVSGIRPNFDVIRGYKERAKGLAYTDEDIDELYRRLFKRDPYKGNGPARRAVLEILISRADQTPEYLSFSLLNNVYVRCKCYFNAQKTCYYLVHEDFRKRLIRTSMTYSSKERITTLWNMNKIVWVEKKPMPKDLPNP